MKKTYKILAGLICGFVFLVGLSPLSTKAAVTGLAFGGFNVVTIPCTCSKGVFWHFFTPFYNNTSVPTVGALASVPRVSIVYLYYAIHPGNWALGTYYPGIQTCWMSAAFFCFPLPNLGWVNWPTGTSP